ncbi:MAG: D-aminoacylase [Candidatus Marinimicrobia bacterium]|nr:D-aminoacylase [Candidatus Neomarinimicrobiota bacterium]
MKRLLSPGLAAGLLTLLFACGPAPDVDTLIRGGMVVDGSGHEPYVADLAIAGDTIFAIGNLDTLSARRVVDATGLAVAPGFINMLSWANVSLIHDGHSQSDIRQGVTLEVLGEGWSMGPINETMRQDRIRNQRDIIYPVEWTTLGEYLQWLEERGVSTNIASFVGATTVRIHEVGYDNRAATDDEMERMQQLVATAMEEGAMGLSSSLEYAPADYANTSELIALAKIAARYDGLYITHMRHEGDHIDAALDELFSIVKTAGIRGEIYHFKMSHRENWEHLDAVITRIEKARSSGLPITADMYAYHASSTGLGINFPTWVQEGGASAWLERLRDPQIRARMHAEMTLIPPEDIMLVSFNSADLRRYIGQTVADVMAERGTGIHDTVIDLILENGGNVGTIRFTMSEENIRKKVALPWVSFSSDAGSRSNTGLALQTHHHPRGYGNFARVLGKYVREEQLLTLADAVRRLSALPAENLKLRRRGQLLRGHFADVVIFDPATITDHATFKEPHRYATGVHHVWVNGQAVISAGQHTGATPGRFVKGPGWSGWQN